MLEDKELEKLKDFQKRLEQTPAGKQLLEQEAAAILATRKEAAEAIKAIEKERDGTLPKLQADLDAKEKNFLKAKTIMEEAGAALNQAKGAAWTANNNYSISISHLEQSLFESADPALDEAKEFFNEKLAWLRSPGRISHTAIGSERNLFSDTVTVHDESNLPAINEALGYCQAAIQELEKMKLEPVLNLPKIEAMKKAIPDINVYSEETAEVPLPGSKGRSFESYFKSADHTDYEVSKLLEKASKLLSPAPKRARA